MPMDLGGNLELIYNLHVKSLGLFRRVSMACRLPAQWQHTHLFAQDLQGNFFHEQTDRLGIGAESFP